MGAHSTIYLTRDKAMALILSAVPTMPDSELERFADIILDQRLYNCRITGDHDSNDNDLA